MKKENVLKQIKKAALKDKKNRRDPRYIKTLAFLTKKGFLFTNQAMPKGANLRLRVDDAVWAGKNLEPRILEVLPAAVLRLGKHFDFAPNQHRELAKTLEDLKNHKITGHDFYGVPYEKLKVWVDFKLKDGRVKSLQDRKVTRTFRLKPQILQKLESLAKKSDKNLTTVLEELIQGR